MRIPNPERSRLLQFISSRWPQRLRFSLNSLRTQLLLWIALPAAIVLIGVSMLEIRGHEHAMHELVQERAAGLAKAAAVLIAGRIDHGFDTLVDVAEEISTHRNGPIISVAHFPAGVVMYRPGGEILGATHPAAWPLEAAVQQLVQAMGGDETQRTVTLYDQTSGQWLLVQAIRTFGDGEPGVLAGAIPVEQLASRELIGTFLPSTPLSMWIEGPEGNVIATLAGDTHPPAGADKTVHVEIAIMDTGWRIVARESWAEMVPPLLRYEGAALLGVLMAMIVAAISAYFGLRSIVRPLHRLDEAARQVGWGHYDAVRKPVGGVAEIEDLRLALVRMVDQVRQYQQEMKSYIGAMTLGQEEERKRLARELHDETVQAMIVLKQQIELAEKSLVRDPQEVAERLRQLHPLVTGIIDDLRRQIHDLRPLYLEDLGLVTALEMLVRQTADQHGLIGDFEVSGHTERKITPAIELSAFRIAQEAIRNVVAHAQADWIHIELIIDQSGLTLGIEDNGTGFDAPRHPHQLAHFGHYGLIGIQERVQLHGGRLEIDSEVGKGTLITVWLPTEEANLEQ